MAKTPTKITVPAGFKVSETNDRKAQPMYLAFVDKDQGIFASRKGAVARDRTMEGLVAKLGSKDVLSGLTRVSRTATVKPATKTGKGATAKELESID